jgi:predicted extracellular nuclease
MSSSATNGIYNYAAGDPATATDRAVGFLSSGTATKSGNLYAHFTNGTGGPLTGLQISYQIEKYRNGSNPAGFSVQLYYSSDGSNWTSAGANFLTSLAFDVDNSGFSNAPGLTKTVTSPLTVMIPNGSDVYLAWNYSVISTTTTSNAQALGIDDVTVLGIAAPTSPTGIGRANPAVVIPISQTLLTVSVTPGINPASTGITVRGDLAHIGGLINQPFYDDGTYGDVTAGDNIFSFLATVAPGISPELKNLAITIGDAQGRSSNTTLALMVVSNITRIREIQGASHISPKNNQSVSNVPGIVTATRSKGFFLQDSSPDQDIATSEGIYVSTATTPTVGIGDLVVVDGTVQENRPFTFQCYSPDNLTITQIVTPTGIVTVTSGNSLPAPIVLGTGGRIPPNQIIEDDATGNVETSGVFDPNSDGIDFYESLEGMLVQINSAVVVGPNSSSKFVVLGDNGANATTRTTRGGIVIQPGDYNPERIIIDKMGTATTSVKVSDYFTAPLVGVMDYDECNFNVLLTQSATATQPTLTQETTAAPTANELAVATFNLKNLHPGDTQSKFTNLAIEIVINLQAPDLIAVEEIQDNNGAASGSSCAPDGVVDASTTWTYLIASIQAVGGPTYTYRQIDPEDDQDGGAPCGNIRQGFFFRTDRGLSFIDRPGATATTAVTVTLGLVGPQLSYSPGRIDPTNSAFTDSRKPLAGEFVFKGKHLFVIANHFNSKAKDDPLNPLLGDDPLFGRWQPPLEGSMSKRIQQATVVNSFVNSILALDSQAKIIVLGDFNDYEFSTPLATLKGTPPVLHNLVETLPLRERYTYVYQGNSQAIDYIFVSDSLLAVPWVFDIVHVNSEFTSPPSDHDPAIARINLSQFLYLPLIFK